MLKLNSFFIYIHKVTMCPDQRHFDKVLKALESSPVACEISLVQNPAAHNCTFHLLIDYNCVRMLCTSFAFRVDRQTR